MWSVKFEKGFVDVRGDTLFPLGPFHLISTPPLWMMFLFLQSLRNNVALTPSEIPMDEFKNIAAPLEIPMISSETLQKSTMDEFVF